MYHDVDGQRRQQSLPSLPVCGYKIQTLEISHCDSAPIEKNAVQRIHLGNEVTSSLNLERNTLQQRRARGLESYSVMSEEMRTVRGEAGARGHNELNLSRRSSILMFGLTGMDPRSCSWSDTSFGCRLRILAPSASYSALGRPELPVSG